MADTTPCQPYEGFWPHWWYPWTVNELKKQFAAQLVSANLAATACKNIDSVTLGQWSAFYAAAFAWSQEGTYWFGVGGQADQAQRWQCELYAWQQKLATLQCSVVSSGNPSPASPPTDWNKVSQTAQWIGILAASVAGAYAVGKVAEVVMVGMHLLPERKPR